MNHDQPHDLERPSSCPSGESLLAYLMAGAGQASGHADVAQHLNSCDACVLDLQRASRRMSLQDEVAAPVPAAVLAQVQSSSPAAAPPAAWRVAWRRFVGSLRLPVLAPAAAAVALVLAVGLPRQGEVVAPAERTRDVAVRQSARLTGDATVHAEPAAAARVVARLDRGASVVLLDRRDAWVKVECSDGTAGWMERGALE